MGTAGSLRIGLTGGIGSGKSTVAAMFVERGATLIDTDAIARSLTATGGIAIDAIRLAFGAEALDVHGGLDRAFMRQQAFTDASTKTRLENILHPLIAAECERQAHGAAESVRVFDVPLLVESKHWRQRVDRVLVVDCHEGTQVQRVVQRSGWTVEMAQAVITQQASRTQRRLAADAVIFNDGLPLTQLAEEVAALWQRWCP